MTITIIIIYELTVHNLNTLVYKKQSNNNEKKYIRMQSKQIK